MTDDRQMGQLHTSPFARRRRGFTLLELLITVAIVGILMAIGVPAMQQFLAEQAAAASADELAEGIRFARTEATKRGVAVKICASTDTAQASPTCAGAGDDNWRAGWIVVDANGNLIRVQEAMRSISTVDSSAAAEIDFVASGMPSTAGGATFILTPVGESDVRVRTVAVNAQGRVKVSKGSS